MGCVQVWILVYVHHIQTSWHTPSYTFGRFQLANVRSHFIYFHSKSTRSIESAKKLIVIATHIFQIKQLNLHHFATATTIGPHYSRQRSKSSIGMTIETFAEVLRIDFNSPKYRNRIKCSSLPKLSRIEFVSTRLNDTKWEMLLLACSGVFRLLRTDTIVTQRPFPSQWATE